MAAKKASAWDQVADGVTKKAKAVRVSLREQKEAQQAAILQGYVQAMKGNADIAAVQEESLIALTNIIAKGAGIRTLVRTGGLDTIVLAMTVHINAADIQQRAATAIATVAAVGEDCRDAVVTSGCVKALVDGANRHPEMPSVLERGCHALAVIAAQNPPGQDALIDAHAVTAVTRAMRLWPRRANLINKAVSALSAVSAGSIACKMALVHTGAVTVLCDAMEEHTGHAEIQQTGCYCLAGVARGGDSSVKAVVKAGGVRRLVAALRYFPTQSSVVHVIASAFASLGTCHDDAVRNELASANVIPHLMNALMRHRHRATVAERGLAALCNLMMGGSRFVTSCLKQGGFDFLTEVMATHSAFPSLLLQGCHCVLNAAAISDLDTKEQMISASCPERILQAMSNNPINARLIEAGCAALANVAAGTGDEHEEELKISHLSLQEPDPTASPARLPSQGGGGGARGGAGGGAGGGQQESRPGTSASVSRSRPGSRRVSGEERLHKQLQNIRASLLDAGTAFNVVKAMSDFKAEPSVTEEGICVLRNLAAGEDTNLIDRLLKCESAQAINYSMKLHRSSQPICLQGCLAIRNLACGTSRHLSMLIEANAVEAVIDALVEHKGEPVLAQAGCAALRNLAVDSWGSDQPSRFSQSAGAVSFITQSDGAAAIVEAMQACANSAPVQAQACGAVRNLACGTLGDSASRTGALDALMRAGALEAIVSSMRAHGESRAVQAQACGALRNLAIGPEFRSSLFQVGAVRDVVGVLRAHAQGAPEVLEQATACLANLLFTRLNAGGSHHGQGSPGGNRSPSPAHFEDLKREALGVGAVGELCNLLASRQPGPGLMAPHGAMIAINCCACLASLLDASGTGAAEILSHAGALDGVVGLCTVFGNESASAVEHSSSCLSRLLSTGGPQAHEAISSLPNREELGKVLEGRLSAA